MTEQIDSLVADLRMHYAAEPEFEILNKAAERIAALEAGTEFRDDSISKLERKVQHWQERTEAAEARLADALAALTAIYEWWDRDGSVGGASLVFDENRATLARLTAEQKGGDDDNA